MAKIHPALSAKWMADIAGKPIAIKLEVTSIKNGDVTLALVATNEAGEPLLLLADVTVGEGDTVTIYDIAQALTVTAQF